MQRVVLLLAAAILAGCAAPQPSVPTPELQRHSEPVDATVTVRHFNGTFDLALWQVAADRMAVARSGPNCVGLDAADILVGRATVRWTPTVPATPMELVLADEGTLHGLATGTGTITLNIRAFNETGARFEPLLAWQISADRPAGVVDEHGVLELDFDYRASRDAHPATGGGCAVYH
ncbi:MAG: hypothetical protein V4510_00280 [bacterium]